MEGLFIVFLVLINWEVASLLGMGVEFKDKIMLHDFREVKCQWEVVEVGRWERWKCNEAASCEKRESGKVVSWEVPGFIQC